ncbi:MAG TPA: carboxypeptidase-like regulatory domain-containing protein, partial [Chitinophagales bacterium]|nr:carboxypeptidase-like regulatory domain-containing protein [Chitinophagales bacterium]
SGNVSDLVTSENISYAVVTFKDESIEKVYGKSTDTLGKFSIIIPAGSYTFKVFFVGYAEINLDLTIRTGEMREINTGLGQDEAFVTYEINSPKKLNRRQLREEANKLNIKE